MYILKSGVPILMYHRLGEVRADSIVPGHYVTQARFESHLKLIHRLGMTTVTLGELSDGFAGKRRLPRRPIVISFDDGYESFYRLGLPLLEKYGMKATMFLVSDLVGDANAWDLIKGDVEEKLMSREQILEAQSKGIEMGSHTCRHASLSEVSIAEAREEIFRSKHDLEALLGKPVDFICYPYGNQNETVRQLARQAGYRGATSTHRHGNTTTTDAFDWGRINVRYNFTAWKLFKRLLTLKPSQAPKPLPLGHRTAPTTQAL